MNENKEILRGIAEIEVVHRDVNGNIKSVEKSTHPIRYQEDEAGNPINIQEV